MGYGKLLLPLAVLALAGGAQADAYKCRTPDGKTMISSLPCQDGSKTEAVQPSEKIPVERKNQADQERERQRQRLTEREAAKAAEEQREQESRRKLAEEESARRTQCLQNAEREPDAQSRADLIAACNGVAPQRPIVVQQPVFVPVSPTRKTQGPITVCLTGDCKNAQAPNGHQPAHPEQNTKECRQIGGKAPICPE